MKWVNTREKEFPDNGKPYLIWDKNGSWIGRRKRTSTRVVCPTDDSEWMDHGEIQYYLEIEEPSPHITELKGYGSLDGHLKKILTYYNIYSKNDLEKLTKAILCRWYKLGPKRSLELREFLELNGIYLK